MVAPGDAGYGEHAWGMAESETEVMVLVSEHREGRVVETAMTELEPCGGHQQQGDGGRGPAQTMGGGGVAGQR